MSAMTHDERKKELLEGDVCKLHLTLFERKWKTEDCFVMI